jgi:hypothetical protein
LDYYESKGKSKKEIEEFGVEVWFPSAKELTERGIVFQHIVQKPGDAVYNGYGCIHWVYNPVSHYSIFHFL